MSFSSEVLEGVSAPRMLLARLKSYLSFHHNHVQVFSVEKVLVVYLMSMMCLCKKKSFLSNMMAYGVVGLDQGQRDLWSRGTWVNTVLGCDHLTTYSSVG